MRAQTAGAAAAKTGKERRRTDAIELLRQDHRQIEALFDSFRTALSDSDKEELAATICERLKVHGTIETEIFYPAAREALEGDADVVDEAVIEHESAGRLIAEIEVLTPADATFEPRMTVLEEQIRHHFREEEGEIIHPLRASELDLRTLGKRMAERRLELEAEMQRVPVVHGPPKLR